MFGDDWPFEFDKKIVEALNAPEADKNHALNILSSIVEKTIETDDDGIIRHAIRRLDNRQLWSQDWDLLQHFLAQCAIQFPHSFDYVARVVAWRNRVHKDVDLALWLDVARLTIDQNAALGRDSEVIWAMWLLKEMNSKLPKRTTDLVLLNSGPLVLALLVHMHHRKLTNDKGLVPKLRQKVTGNPISGQYWPLTLEMIHLGLGLAPWLTASPTVPLRKLHEEGATIIAWETKPKVFASSDQDEQDDDEPAYAIEDYGADYSGDEDYSGADDDGSSADSSTDADVDSFIEGLLGFGPASPIDSLNEEDPF